jgi:hypothetical protein
MPSTTPRLIAVFSPPQSSGDLSRQARRKFANEGRRAVTFADRRPFLGRPSRVESMMELDDDVLLSLIFHTAKFLEAELTGARSRPLLGVISVHRKWTVRILSALLNERSYQ